MTHFVIGPEKATEVGFDPNDNIPGFGSAILAEPGAVRILDEVTNPEEFQKRVYGDIMVVRLVLCLIHAGISCKQL